MIKNTSGDLIATPVLEVTFVTKEQPNTVITKRLVLSASPKAGESRPFHSGGFSGPPVVSPTGAIAEAHISHIKSTRIHPGSMFPASADWTVRLAGREAVSCEGPALTFEQGRWRGVRGDLVATAGTKIQSAEFSVSYFDVKGELVDVQTFTVQRRDGKCIDSFPFSFETGSGVYDAKIIPTSVKCLCERVSICP